MRQILAGGSDHNSTFVDRGDRRGDDDGMRRIGGAVRLRTPESYAPPGWSVCNTLVSVVRGEPVSERNHDLDRRATSAAAPN
jgi:hypothetical protein